MSVLLIPYHCTPRVMYFRQYLFWLLSVNRAEVKYLGNKTEVGVCLCFGKRWEYLDGDSVIKFSLIRINGFVCSSLTSLFNFDPHQK